MQQFYKLSWSSPALSPSLHYCNVEVFFFLNLMLGGINSWLISEKNVWLISKKI